MDSTILRSEAMRLIRSGQPVKVEFVTANRRTGVGGEYLTLDNWMIVSNNPAMNKIMGDRFSFISEEQTKDPNHDRHKTFNMFNPGNPSVKPIKIHYRLLCYVNNKKVING